MAYSEELADLVLPLTNGWENVEIKKMFGGIGYLVNGNMCIGIHKDHLVLRLDPETATELLSEPHVKVFDITGRPMKGWVMVEEDGYSNPNNLKRYVSMAKEFVDTLPGK